MLEHERALIAGVLRKDRKATAEFVSLYADAVYGYVRRRLLPRTELADDLVQEVFLAAWEGLGEFRGDSSLKVWLLGIARHKVEDHYRRRLRRAEETLEDGPAEEPEFEALLDRARLEERAQRVLGALPPEYAAALLWRYWEKRSTEEMALATGKTAKAVERLLARARQQFKKRWQNA